MSVPDRVGNALLVMLSPVVLCWTLYSFWHLATKGTLTLRDHGGIIEASGGFNFWLTLGMYVVFFFGSIIVISMCVTWLLRKFVKK
jgi:hypothetical protein